LAFFLALPLLLNYICMVIEPMSLMCIYNGPNSADLTDDDWLALKYHKDLVESMVPDGPGMASRNSLNYLKNKINRGHYGRSYSEILINDNAEFSFTTSFRVENNRYVYQWFFDIEKGDGSIARFEIIKKGEREIHCDIRPKFLVSDVEEWREGAIIFSYFIDNDFIILCQCPSPALFGGE
jgi:hypothetical protein